MAHASGRRFEARTAIVTLPVGVLQAGVVEFEPPLSQTKLRAIEDFGTGALILVTAEFRRPFWEERIGRVPHFRSSAPSPFRTGFKDYFWDRPGPPTLCTHMGPLRPTSSPAMRGASALCSSRRSRRCFQT